MNIEIYDQEVKMKVFDLTDIGKILGELQADIKQTILFAYENKNITEEQYNNILHTIQVSFKNKLKKLRDL